MLAVVPAFLLADALHAAYIACAIDAWKDGVELTAEGVIAGCEAYELNADESAVTGTALLLVHGFNASPRHYEFVAPALAKRGFDCRVLRLPGFAEPSALGRDRDYRVWIEAVAEELRALKKEHARVGVVGHSLGGAVTLGVLLEGPELADFAVLVAPALAVSDERAPVLSTRTWHEVSRRLLLFTRVLRSPFPMDCQDPDRPEPLGRMPFSCTRIADELFHLMDHLGPRAERLETPLTMLVSRDDRIVDTPTAEAYFGRIGTEDKRLVVLEQSGHEALLDREWERVVEAIAERAAPNRDRQSD